MRALVRVLVLGVVFSLLGCVGDETGPNSDDESANVREGAARFIGVDPSPHGRRPLVFSLCRPGGEPGAHLTPQPRTARACPKGRAR